MSYSIKHQEFRDNIISQLSIKASESKIQSEHQNKPCLQIKRNVFFLDNGHCLTEVTDCRFIDNWGYEYSLNILDTDELCKLADEVLT